MTDPLVTFYKNVELFKSLKGWKTKDLINASGVSRQQLYNYSKGLAYPGLDIMAKIAEALERPLSDFFKEEITIKHSDVPDDIIKDLASLNAENLEQARTAIKALKEIQSAEDALPPSSDRSTTK